VYIVIGTVGVADNLFVLVVFALFIKITDKVETHRHNRLRCVKETSTYTEKHHVDISTMFQEADDASFRRPAILSNRSHVLYAYLSEPPRNSILTTN